MGELIAFGQCVLLAPGVEVGKNALAPPLAQGNHQPEGHQQHGGDQEEHAALTPPRNRMPIAITAIT